MLRKQSEKKEKEKDESYYIQKIEDLRKMKLNRKALTVGDGDSDNGNIEVWSTYSEDEEVRKPTHEAYFVVNKTEEVTGGKCLKVKSSSSES